MSRTISILAAFGALVAGTLLIVYAYREDDNPTNLAHANGQEIGARAEVNEPQAVVENDAPGPQNAPTAKPESDAPKPQGDVASPAVSGTPPPGSPEVIDDFNRLPDEIRDTLQGIVVAAQSGNIDNMLPVLQENELPPMLSAISTTSHSGRR